MANLAGGLAHDFNNVLMAILGNISLAALASPSPEELQDRLASGEQGCYQALSLAQQFLTCAKGERLAKKPLDLGKIVKETARLVVTCSKSRVDFSLP